MQEFSFHRKADRLRSEVRLWQIAVSAEAAVMVAMGIAMLPVPGIQLLLITPVYFVFVWWFYSRPLRRRHRLTETTLTLVEKSGKRFPIPREQIRSVQRFNQPLPRGVKPVTYKYLPDDDTLYILPDKQNLVAIDLHSPVSAKLTPRVIVEFTRVVCMVDEPDAFMAAISPEAGIAQVDDDRPAVTPPAVSAPALATGPATIQLMDLTKRFGDDVAVDRLTLRVAPGEIFAFLGSNGAGKSTTIKMLVGLLRPSSGQVLLGGQDPWQDLRVRRLVGYVPDTPMLYENLTAREHLWLIGGLYDLPEPDARLRADELLRQVGLEPHGDQPVRTFSLGMKRKLSIASALMHRPSILLLDEVTNGLDPRAAREVKEFIRKAAASGTTIFLTTHLLDLVRELADRVAIIDQGVLTACGTLAELQKAYGLEQGSLEDLFLLATERKGVPA